jgi:voltage-gated potassium channel
MWPLTVAAAVFLFAYAIPITIPKTSADVAFGCEVLVWTIWAVFVVDYLIRLVLAERKWLFIRKNLLDLAVVVMPALRPLRLLRLLSLLSVLRRASGGHFRGRVLAFTIGATLLVLILGGLAITDAERGAEGSTINTLGDGMWWALTTITTVGYGDLYPVTLTGRLVSAALMISGIAVLGMVTATLASWLVQRVSEATDDDGAVTRRQVEELSNQITELRAELLARRIDEESLDAMARESSGR